MNQQPDMRRPVDPIHMAKLYIETALEDLKNPSWFRDVQSARENLHLALSEIHLALREIEIYEKDKP